MNGQLLKKQPSHLIGRTVTVLMETIKGGKFKKILQYFESPCSQTYVSKPYLIDFSSYLQRFIHNKACDRYPKKQRKTEFVEQVNENDNNVEALENKAKIAVVIIV